MHTLKRRRFGRGCRKGKSLERDCCCTVATSKYTALEGGVVQMMVQQQSEKKMTLWCFHGSAWLGGAERNPLRKNQLARLWTPRARVTEPGGVQTCAVVYPRAPRMHRCRERQKRLTAAGQELAIAQKGLFLHVQKLVEII